MFKGDRNFAVGLFVSVAILLFVGFVVWLTGRTGVEETHRYSLRFDRDVSGLALGGSVKYMGVNIGSVVAMGLEREDGIKVQVDIEVLQSTPVDTGTYASIAMQGITGVAVINLASDPGAHSPLPVPADGGYPVIPVRETGFAAVLSTMPEIMSKLDTLLAQASEILNEENRGHVTATLRNIDQVTGSLAQNRDALASIPAQLEATLADIQGAVAQLNDTIAQAAPGVPELMENLQQSSENLARLTARMDDMLSRHESNIDQFLDEGLAQAPELISESRRAIRELEKLLQQLSENPSLLIHRGDTRTVEVDP